MDINKTPQELIIEDINTVNGTQLTVPLNANDFLFSAPATFTDPANAGVNTKITITAKPTSGYYNSIDWKYRRMDLGAILATQAVSILPGDATLLSEIIPQVNTALGINLTEEDYVDTPLPEIDPLLPELTAPVIIQSKATSLLFIGAGTIVLGTMFHPVPSPDDQKVRYFYTVSSGYGPDGSSMVDCSKINGERLENWGYFQNASALGKSIITSSYLTTDGLILNGEFEFRAKLIGNATEFDYAAACVLISRDTGYVLRAWNDAGFVASTSVVGQWMDGYVYKADATDKIIRFDTHGEKDTAYTPAITYVPTALHVDHLGRVYSVSAEYFAPAPWHSNNSASHRRIDRLLATGELDTTFTPIILGNSLISGAAPAVTCLSSIADGNIISAQGFYVLLNSANNSSLSSAVPVINGTRVLPAGATTLYAYNTVLKFTETGAMDSTYKRVMPDMHPEAIIKYPLNIPTGQQAIAASGAGVTFLTKKVNPITGFEHRQPISFTNKGNLALLGGMQYYDSYRWTDVMTANALSNGQMAVGGSYMQRLPSGEWSSVAQCVALYTRYGEAVQPIWRQVLATTGSPVINNVHLREV